MAKSRKSSAPMFRNSRIFMLLFGLILGLGIAVGVAYFITQVPMPFADKFSRAEPTQPMPDLRQAPDPNQTLSGRTEAITPSTVTPPKPLEGNAPGVNLQDDIGALLTTLGAPPATSAQPASVPPPTVAAAPKPTTPAAPSAPPAAKPAPGTQTTYYLQAGAFRAEPDALAMQARILMLGQASSVQPAQVNGTTLYRVRVGPFKGIDEMNRLRATLSNAKIETTVVRP